MINILQKLGPRIIILVGYAFLLLVVSDSSQAGNSWLDKGKSLLESIGRSNQATEPTIEAIGDGLKEALRVGSENVVSRLGSMDGFNADPSIHIPLPETFNDVKQLLDKVGMSGLLDDLELKMNRAAEAATPKAKQLFWQAISEMRFEDVNSIFNGPEDAATQYFKAKMTPSLSKAMQPVVDQSLLEVGAIKAYDETMSAYHSLPFVPDVKADLSDHVVEKGIDGIFYYLAKEEAAIRNDPAKRTTEILREIFGQ
jgi:hypothetical protein